jgi:hypothetical protein
MTPIGLNAKATKIMIIRHAEKPLTDPPTVGVEIDGTENQDSLIVQGWQRAGALVALFAPARGPLQDDRLATPQFIYATKVGGKSSKPEEGSTSSDLEENGTSADDEGNRPQETVTPLIERLQRPPVDSEEVLVVQPNFNFTKDLGEEMVASALSCDGVVLICWPHGQIPSVASYIPLSPDNKHPLPTGKWPSDRFDIVWVFDLDTNTGAYHFHQVPQLLLAGDIPEHLS